jgi:AraC-like DNA-binding protein
MSFPESLTLMLILGVAQGVFLAILLLTRKENSVANRILAGAMIAFSVWLIDAALYSRNYYLEYPHLIGISQPVIYLFGPMIYLYTRTLSTGARSLDRRSLVHFIPALVVTAYMVPFFLQSGAEKILFVEKLMREGSPLDVKIIEWLKLPHGAIYTLVTFRLLRRYREQLEENFSTLDRINLRWLRNLLIGAMMVWLVAILHFVLGALGMNILDSETNPASLLTVLFVYAIGYIGLRQPEVFWPPAEDDGPDTPSAEAPIPETPGKYRKSGMDSEKAETQLKALLELMDEQKPYTDPNLTLHQIANQLSVSPHNLSEVINTRLDKSFHDFVNGYRVDEAKNRLVDAKLANQTILAIAYESGFRSKSTFNKIFKKFTGTTPSSFRHDLNPQ